MNRDIFVMQQIAQTLDVRNTVVAPDPEWNMFITESVALLSVPEATINHCQCGNLLTIEDRYTRCRECMISI